MSSAPQPRLAPAEIVRRFEWEAHHGVVETGRYRCRYVSWGSGPPLVFLHGLGDSMHAWMELMALLQEQYRCIAYDQPIGHGDGARIRGYRLEHLVDDLFLLLDHLKLPSATLVGHSLGSTIALGAMHCRPQRIDRGVLVGGFAHRPLRRREWGLAWIGRFLPGRIRIIPKRTRQLEQPDRQALIQTRSQNGAIPIKTIAHWAFQLHQVDVRSLLPEIHQPVLLVCGDGDPLVPHVCQQELFRQLPRATMFQIEQCGHFPMATHPEALAYALR